MNIREKDINKALAVIAEIKWCGSILKSIELNELQLFGAFYKAHLEYAKLTPGFLSNYPIVRLSSGPSIYHFDLLKNSKMTKSVSINSDEMTAIREAVDWVVDGKMSYDKSWSWLNAKDGEILDIYVDLTETLEEYEANRKLHKDLLNEAEQIFEELDRKEV